MMNSSTTRATKTKVLLGVAASLLALLSITARPAAADAPVISRVVVRMDTPGPVGESCPGFPVVGTLVSERTSITFYENGTPVRQIRHVNFEGMLYNGNTGYGVPWDGHFTRTQNYVENTVRFTGLRLRAHIPGEPIRALRVGNTILDLSENPPELIFVAGQLEWQEQICAILRR